MLNGCRLAPTREHETLTILVATSKSTNPATRSPAEPPLLVALLSYSYS